MLTTARRRLPWHRAAPLAAALLALPLLLPHPGRAQLPDRPEGLVVLDERPSQGGLRVLGIYGPREEVATPGLWRVSFWQQQGGDTRVRTDTVRCSAAAPMRLTLEQGRWQMRLLNPGGPITAANRVDHLVWWAVCHPAQAGRDPAELGPLARQLGYSTALRESVQLLPGRAR